MTAPPATEAAAPDRLAQLAPGIFVVIWSSGFAVARYGMRDAGALTFLAVRMIITVVLLVVLAVITGAPRIDRRTAGWTALAAVGLHVLYLGGVWMAIDRGLPAGLGALIAGIHPVLTSLGGRFALGEHLVARQWGGVALGFLGVALVVIERFSAGTGEITAEMGALMAMAVVGMSGGTLVQRSRAAAMPLVSGSIVQYATSAVVLSAVVLSAGVVAFEGIDWNTTATLVWSMVWSIAALSIGSTLLLMWLISRQAAARVSSLFFLTPSLSMIEAWVLFGERIGALAIAGMVAALVGVALVTRPPAK